MSGSQISHWIQFWNDTEVSGKNNNSGHSFHFMNSSQTNATHMLTLWYIQQNYVNRNLKRRTGNVSGTQEPSNTSQLNKGRGDELTGGEPWTLLRSWLQDQLPTWALRKGLDNNWWIIPTMQTVNKAQGLTPSSVRRTSSSPGGEGHGWELVAEQISHALWLWEYLGLSKKT